MALHARRTRYCRWGTLCDSPRRQDNYDSKVTKTKQFYLTQLCVLDAACILAFTNLPTEVLCITDNS